MEFDYVIVCYRVMYRMSKDTDFSFCDFSCEDEAFELFQKALNDNFEVKMFKILGLCDWYIQ